MFKALYSWCKYKVIPASVLFRNRLFLEREARARRQLVTFGYTFISSHWTLRTLRAPALIFVTRWRRTFFLFLLLGWAGLYADVFSFIITEGVYFWTWLWWGCDFWVVFFSLVYYMWTGAYHIILHATRATQTTSPTTIHVSTGGTNSRAQILQEVVCDYTVSAGMGTAGIVFQSPKATLQNSSYELYTLPSYNWVRPAQHTYAQQQTRWQHWLMATSAQMSYSTLNVFTANMQNQSIVWPQTPLTISADYAWLSQRMLLLGELHSSATLTPRVMRDPAPVSESLFNDVLAIPFINYVNSIEGHITPSTQTGAEFRLCGQEYIPTTLLRCGTFVHTRFF